MISLRRLAAPLFLGLMVASGAAVAAESSSKPSGTVTINETQFGFILGGSVGGGELTYQGKKYPFKIGGISVGANFGVSKLSAVGEVFNLTDISKFPGTYAKLDSNVSVGGGVGGMVMRNEHGVVMSLTSTQEGLQFNMSANGVSVKME